MPKQDSLKTQESPFGDEVVLVDGIPVRADQALKDGADQITSHLNFDGGNFDGWSTRRLVSDYSATISSDVVRVGTYAARFELRQHDYVSEGARAELRDWLNAPLEDEIWYGFSTFIPADFPIAEGIGCVLAQWHDQAKLGDPSGKPPIAVRFKDGRLSVTGSSSAVASHDPDQRYEFYRLDDFQTGRWHDFNFRVNWSRYGQSQIDAWLNGEGIIGYRGKLGYENETVGPYFKLGMYCHGPLKTPHVAYHDNYSRGHSYRNVDPSLQHVGTGT